jgi:hypothetical protein
LAPRSKLKQQSISKQQITQPQLSPYLHTSDTTAFK